MTALDQEKLQQALSALGDVLAFLGGVAWALIHFRIEGGDAER
jgi:hypothetical protein